jgi:hypothetical protein
VISEEPLNAWQENTAGGYIGYGRGLEYFHAGKKLGGNINEQHT